MSFYQFNCYRIHVNRFREWLNAFQAKQSPEINESLYKDIIDELNKRRISDLSILNRENN